MLAIGIITLLLTGFVLVYYAYLFRNTDHDVSFFIGVGLIAMVMNLFTNASASARVLSVLYLIVDVVFIALGWLVDVDGSKRFYTSIGPFFAAEFANTRLIAYKVVSFVVPVVGIVMYFAFYKSDKEKACACGACGLWCILLWALLAWAIVGIL